MTRGMYSDMVNWKYILSSSLNTNYHYYLKKGSAPPILNIDLKVTKRCNANCYFCYAEITKGKAEELNTSQIINFVNSFGKKRIAYFITGGEPFLRKDIFEIILAIKKQGSYCGIVTNGSLLNDEKIKKLLNSNIDNVVFSLHGLCESNDKILRLKKTYEKILNSINKLNQLRNNKKPYIVINSVINPNTFREFKKLVEVTEDAGADAIRFVHPSFLYPNEAKKHIKESFNKFGYPVESTQYITKNPLIYNESNNEMKVVKKIDTLNQIKNKLNAKIKILFYPELSKRELPNWYGNPFKSSRKCLYIYTSIYINEIGDVHPCQYYSISMGNILKQKFEDVWNSKRYRKFRIIVQKSLLPGCARCCKLF